MHAAVVTTLGQSPRYQEFPDPRFPKRGKRLFGCGLRGCTPS